MAATFRRAQLVRLDGDSPLRHVRVAPSAGQLAPHPSLAAWALTAAWMELGETEAVLRASCAPPACPGDAGQTTPATSKAPRLRPTFRPPPRRRAGRRAGLFRAEALKPRVRSVQPTISTAISTPPSATPTSAARLPEAELRGLRAVVRRDPPDALHRGGVGALVLAGPGRARGDRGRVGRRASTRRWLPN